MCKTFTSFLVLFALATSIYLCADIAEESVEENSPTVETPQVEAVIETLPSTDFCYFVPPKGWEIAKPETLGKQVKMAFIKKNSKEPFCPSLNLAVEEIEGNLNDYLSDIKAIHEQDRKNQWRKLGKVRTASGDAQLTEIDTSSPLGPVRILQLLLLKNNRVYIVTAAALRRDFCNYYREFQDTFRSLTITSDLFETIPQFERRIALKAEQEALYQNSLKNKGAERVSSADCQDMSENENSETNPINSSDDVQKKQWGAFEKKVLDDFEDMGTYWQTLMLTHTHQSIGKK